MLEKKAKKFLKRMINNHGFIAGDIKNNRPKFWTNNNKCSSTFMNMSIFAYLYNNGFIHEDKHGRFLITKKGQEFITPWYKKWLI